MAEAVTDGGAAVDSGGAPHGIGSKLRKAAPGVGVAAFLALLAVPTPLYTGNQNTYLVRGVAQQLGGPLTADRLVRGADPTRFFTWIVRLDLAIGLGGFGFYLLWAVGAITFFAALWWVVSPKTKPWPHALVWAGTVAVILVPFVQTLAARVRDRADIDLPLPANLFDGVAFQYALGPAFQPSMGGVAMVLGVVVAVRRRDLLLAVGLLWLGTLVHPTYLISDWLLLVGVVAAVLGLDPRTWWPKAVKPVLLAVGLSVVVVLANLPTFGAVTGSERDEGNRILADIRVPNHSDPGHWFTIGTALILVFVALAVVLALRSSRLSDQALGRFLLVATGVIGLVTVVVWIIGAPSLRLTFPWRASVVVVPLASTYLVGALAAFLTTAADRRLATAFGAVGAVALVVCAGFGVREVRSGFQDRPTNQPLIQALRASSPAGEGLVPEDLEDVRLNAELPIYVDWNNNPNQPDEVVDWYARLQRTRQAMADPDALCQLVEDEQFGWVVYPSELTGDGAPTCLTGWTTSEPEDGLVLAIRPAS